MDKLEKERAQVEERRIHRLVLEGKIRHNGEDELTSANTAKKNRPRNGHRKVGLGIYTLNFLSKINVPGNKDRI